MQRLRRPPRRGIGGNLQVLEFARARIRRAAQDVREAVRAFEQRRDRLAAEIRARGDRVGTEAIEQRDRLPGRRRPDVAALGVGDDGHVCRHPPAQALERRDPLRAERLEEREVRLDGRDVRQRRIEQQRHEPLDPAEIGREAVGERARVAGSGSTPRQSTVCTAAVRAARRSR